MSEPRNLITQFEPTKRWLKSRNPVKGKDILKWFENEKRILRRRLRGGVVRKFEAHVVEVNRDTEKIVRRSKSPKMFDETLWRISQQDFDVYMRSLNNRFNRIRQEHNAKILAKRERAKRKSKD